MGQLITVAARPGSTDDVRIFTLNRSLTGMDIERYQAATPPQGDRPPDLLAQRLFGLGVDAVTIYSNVVTVDAPKDRWTELEPKVAATIERLFEHYHDA